MNKPHWEWVHDEWINDLIDNRYHALLIKQILIQFASEPVGESLRKSIKLLDKELKRLLIDYVAIYGLKPNMYDLRKVAENKARKAK